MTKSMPRIFLISLLIFLSGCLFYNKITIRGKGSLKLTQVDFESLYGWENDDHKKALISFLHSCNKFAKLPQNKLFGGQIPEVTIGDFRDVCEIAEVVKTMNSKQAKNFFENWFKPFLVEGPSGKTTGVFTGYYEASLNGSKVKTEKYRYPVYGKPSDLGSEEYLSRQEIEEGALKNKGLELLYVDDKVDLFFTHIQGSGRVTMPNGDEIRIGFAGKNNRQYVSISNPMADLGYLERSQLNAATVRDWLRKNPDKADEVMNINEAFTFFRISNNEYVIGAQGVPLTPERSLAVDSDVIPYGSLLWIDTTLKKSDGRKEYYTHLFTAQDTGSAIKGTIRGDIFFGYGKEAEEKAYYMASQGSYYILLPINAVDKILNR
jgi:membrane-bound lytic murein transglycosylase A